MPSLPQAPYLWLAFAVACAIIEIALPSFGFVFAAASAVLGAAAAFAGTRWEIQAVVFALSLIAGVFLLRPRLIKRFEGRGGVPSRADVLIGKLGRVTEAFEHGRGRVTVEGQDWAAHAPENFPIGAEIQVEGSDGIALKVRKTGAP